MVTPMGIVGTGPLLKPQGLLDRRGFWTAGAFGPQEGIGHPNAADRLDPEEDPKDVGAERPCTALGSAVALLRSSSGTPWAAPAPNLLAPRASQAATHSATHQVHTSGRGPSRAPVGLRGGCSWRRKAESTFENWRGPPTSTVGFYARRDASRRARAGGTDAMGCAPIAAHEDVRRRGSVRFARRARPGVRALSGVNVTVYTHGAARPTAGRRSGRAGRAGCGAQTVRGRQARKGDGNNSRPGMCSPT
jgi:hypothetical protein